MERENVFEKLEQFFINVIDQIDEELFSTRSREGIFSPALTMWLMICQRTQSRHSLLGSLESVRDGSSDRVLERNTRSKKAKRKEVSTNSGGLSKARNRVSVATVEQVAEILSEKLISEQKDRWHGKRVLLMDGTLITVAHTKENLEKFPTYSNQNRPSHNSQLRCMCFHELFSGVSLNPEIGAYRGSEAESEQALTLKMLGRLPEDSLLLGDSNFGVFNIAYHAQAEGHQVLLRLSKERAAVLDKEVVTKKSADKKILWEPTTGYRKTYPELPETAAVEGRLIKKIVKNPGCKPLELYFFTTSPQTAAQLVTLYKKRDCIEHDFRALKNTIGLEMLYSKTPAMLHKELILGIAAYNLMRAVLSAAARKLSLQPRQISFSRACALVNIFGNQMRKASSKKEEKDILQEFYTTLRQSKLPNRLKFRVEPRKVARVRKLFPPMRKSRKEERKIARQRLKEKGHRKQETPADKKRKRLQKLRQ